MFARGFQRKRGISISSSCAAPRFSFLPCDHYRSAMRTQESLVAGIFMENWSGFHGETLILNTVEYFVTARDTQEFATSINCSIARFFAIAGFLLLLVGCCDQSLRKCSRSGKIRDCGYLCKFVSLRRYWKKWNLQRNLSHPVNVTTNTLFRTLRVTLHTVYIFASLDFLQTREDSTDLSLLERDTHSMLLICWENFGYFIYIIVSFYLR